MIFSKIKAVGAAGFIVTVIVFLLHQFAGIELPEEVVAALVTVIAYFVGYFKVERVGRYAPQMFKNQ